MPMRQGWARLIQAAVANPYLAGIIPKNCGMEEDRTPVGRPDFKSGEARATCLVGSTPTLFRHFPNNEFTSCCLARSANMYKIAGRLSEELFHE